jgi:hypothetical protein
VAEVESLDEVESLEDSELELLLCNKTGRSINRLREVIEEEEEEDNDSFLDRVLKLRSKKA